MSNATYVYTTYIAATPEKIFDALIDKEATQQYAPACRRFHQAHRPQLRDAHEHR